MPAGPDLGLPSLLTLQGLRASLLAFSGPDPLSSPGMLALQGSAGLIAHFFLDTSSQRAPPAPRLRITGSASSSVLRIFHRSTRRALHRFPRLLPSSLVRRQAPGDDGASAWRVASGQRVCVYLQFLVELFSCCSSCYSTGCAHFRRV